MRVWTCAGFGGHNPVGTAAVVVASSRERARSLLDAELKKQGLPGLDDGDDLLELDLTIPGVRVLCDGEY